MKSIGSRLKVSGPGGDDSSSGGGGDLGAAQTSLEVWTDTGNRRKGEPLELNGLDAAHMIHTNGLGSEKGTLNSSV